MRILYVFSLWTGMQNFFLKGEEKITGMPAFANVFFRLLENKNIEKLYLLLFLRYKEISNNHNINIPLKFKNKLEIVPIFYTNSYDLLFKIPISLLKGIMLVKKNKIDLIYGHGSIGALAGILSLFSKKPNIRRIYGTFLYKEIKDSKISLFMKHPLEYLAFSLPAKCVIITNDGTHGDAVFKKIGNKGTMLIFILNGVDKSMEEKIKPVPFALPQKYISYIARIDYWKRQHLAIEALNILKQKGLNIPLYIIGPTYNTKYYSFLKTLIEKYELTNFVYLIGALPREETWFILKNSYLTLSLYETSNLGNVFLESLVLGVPVIGINNNGSLDFFPQDTFYSVDSDKPYVIARAIEDLWNNKKKRDNISYNAKNFALNSLMTWEERTKLEIDLLLKGRH